MTTHEEQLAHGAQASAISTAMVGLVRDYTGRGPTKARTIIGRDCVTTLMADTLTRAERQMVAHGESDHVLQSRHKLQLMMREDAIKAVERAVDRPVVAFMSDSHIDPDMAAEVFVLESTDPAEDPRPESPDAA
jgi:uncharacterized protein YbcI